MVVYGPPVGQVQELKISQIMVESMFKAAMGDIERFNRKFMILSKEMQVIIILTRFLLLYLGASLSAEARDKGYVQNGGYCTVCKVIWLVCGRELGLVVIDCVIGFGNIQI